MVADWQTAVEELRARFSGIEERFAAVDERLGTVAIKAEVETLGNGLRELY